ncbi:MAG: hypothetical protein H0X50_09880 [Nitrosopumilus sp.]|nr:hypothetical protein [Nitrosopumilus sp.]
MMAISLNISTMTKLNNPENPEYNQIKWSWACRMLNGAYEIRAPDLINDKPFVGDIGLFRVTRIGSHERLIDTNNKKMRIYQGDLIVGVFGNRYATDAYEAEVEGIKDLALLTTAGMVGTIKSRHDSLGRSTELLFLGFLREKASNQKINTKQIIFQQRYYDPLESKPQATTNLLVVVGSGMNSGKTTFVRKLVKSFSQQGMVVAACKLTGSISPRDYDEMVAASAFYATDFSDYGFPSTYKCEEKELLLLFETMMEDIEKANPEIIIMEIADGVLQKETKFLLSDPLFKKRVGGIAVTADSAPSALFTVHFLEKMGYKVEAVSGSITSSPLYVKEFEESSTIPVLSSATSTIKFGSVFGDLMTKRRKKYQI